MHGHDIPLQIAFLLKDVENVTLDFGGATLMIHGRIQPFIIDNCRNVTVKNVVIQYDRSFFTEAELLELTEDHITIRIDEQRYPYEVVDGKLNVYSDTWKNDELDTCGFFMQLFDKKSREGVGTMIGSIGRHITRPTNSFCTPIQFIAEQKLDSVVLYGDVPSWDLDNYRRGVGEEGTVVVLSHEKRLYSAFTFCNCTNVCLDTVRLLNVPGMGILPIHCENIIIRKYMLQYAGKIILNDTLKRLSFDGLNSAFELPDIPVIGSVLIR